jgi:hypothetical protein
MTTVKPRSRARLFSAHAEHRRLQRRNQWRFKMDNVTREPCEQFGPVYPALGATVAKFRRLARRGLQTLSDRERYGYGRAVETAIRALQRSELQRELPSFRSNCASGTWHTDGADIHAAIQRQQRNALLAWPSKQRRARTPYQWQRMYDEAMAGKHREPKAMAA